MVANDPTRRNEISGNISRLQSEIGDLVDDNSPEGQQRRSQLTGQLNRLVNTIQTFRDSLSNQRTEAPTNNQRNGNGLLSQLMQGLFGNNNGVNQLFQNPFGKNKSLESFLNNPFSGEWGSQTGMHNSSTAQSLRDELRQVSASLAAGCKVNSPQTDAIKYMGAATEAAKIGEKATALGETDVAITAFQIAAELYSAASIAMKQAELDLKMTKESAKAALPAT